MSKLESFFTLEYQKKRYTVAYIIHRGEKLPILLDRDIYKNIKNLNKHWYINDKNHVYCVHAKDDQQYQVYMHDIVIKMSSTGYKQGIPIIHINNIHFDNRYENLQFDLPEKEYSKNTKKKRRTINLKKFGIDVNELPTYMWYLKPDKTHGGRFVVDIPNHLNWRSTASKKVSLRYKLEEAKKYLRHMKKMRPDLFSEYSMNGDLTSKGMLLYNEYTMMIKRAGFTINEPIENTDAFLEKNYKGLSDFEIYTLDKYDPMHGSININLLSKEYDDLLID